MKVRYATSLMIGTATAIACPAVAWSQDGATEAETAPAAEIPAAGIGEIVVTAQRRSESLQKSSLSISVLSPEEIGRKGVTATEDIGKVSAGVQIGTAGPTPQIYVRGVGDPGTTALTNPAVALNVAGVYWARPQAAGTSFYDLERIEVLKGPQGTLYGRNASGGAINILPVKPRLGELGGVVNIEVGNYKALHSDGAINVPVGDNAAIRASYQIRHRDAYLSDGSNDDIRQAARLQVLLEPSDTVSLLLFGSYAHMGGVGGGYALYDPAGNPASDPVRPSLQPFDPWTGVADPIAAPISAAALPPPILLPGDPSNLSQNNDFWNLQAELTADLGFATLTFIPAYQYAKLDYHVFAALDYRTRDGAYKGDPENANAYSAELRLSNESDALKWVVGAFYYREDQRFANTLNNGLIQFVSISADIDTKSIAAFGQATYSISDNLRLIGGLRYTDDKRTLDGVGVWNLPVPGSDPNLISGKTASDSVDYKAGFEFDLTPENMLYASIATGYKSGGLSTAIAEPFVPENVDAYTLGMRNRFLDNQLQLNVEGFYLKYDNQHVQVIAPDEVGLVAGLIRNAGEATSYGVEADVIFQFTDNDRLTANATWNRTNYDDFIYETPALFLPPGQTGCVVTPTGNVGVVGPVSAVDCTGQDLPRAPEWAGNIGYSHVFDLGDSGSMTFNADMQFASAREGTTDYIPNTRFPSYQVYNAALTYKLPNDDMTITAFVRNISDEPVYTGALQSNFAATLVAASIAPPRTYGLRLSYMY